MITSASNDKIKYLKQLQTKAKQRKMDGVFVCEGIKLYEELRRDCPERIVAVYVAESFAEKFAESTAPVSRRDWYFDSALLSQMSLSLTDSLGYTVEFVKDSVFETACETVTPQGVLCVARQPHYEAEEYLSKKGPLRLLFLEDVRDPGNMGTILRTAEGAGMDLVIMSSGCVDVFNPKVVRSTMGSIFRVPYVVAEDTSEMLKELKTAGIETYAAFLKGSESFEKVAYPERVAFLIGNEANGLKEETALACDHCIRIPMAGKLESLNAAVAAAVIMYNAK